MGRAGLTVRRLLSGSWTRLISTSDGSIVERTDQLYVFAIEASHLHVLYREIVGRAGIDFDAGKQQA